MSVDLVTMCQICTAGEGLVASRHESLGPSPSTPRSTSTVPCSLDIVIPREVLEELPLVLLISLSFGTQAVEFQQIESQQVKGFELSLQNKEAQTTKLVLFNLFLGSYLLDDLVLTPFVVFPSTTLTTTNNQENI